MTPSTKRLAASIGTIPFIFGALSLIAPALGDLAGVAEPLPAAYACVALLAIVVWILIWRKCVVWSLRAVRQTIASALLFFGLPVVALKLFHEEMGTYPEHVLSVLPIIGWGLWMGVTVSIWPRRRCGHHPEDVVPRCGKCGYLLIGLRATRCPECGDEPTLDELWYATVGEGL